MKGIHLKFIRIGNWQPLGDVRLKSWAICLVLLLLGIGNAVAGAMEWHDKTGMLIFNGVCVVGLVIAVLHKILTMELRKMWRVLSFLLSAFGVLAVFCAQFIENESESGVKILLMVVGAVLLLLGGISMVRWRRYSFAHKEELLNSRSRKRKTN